MPLSYTYNGLRHRCNSPIIIACANKHDRSRPYHMIHSLNKRSLPDLFSRALRMQRCIHVLLRQCPKLNWSRDQCEKENKPPISRTLPDEPIIRTFPNYCLISREIDARRKNKPLISRAPPDALHSADTRREKQTHHRSRHRRMAHR